MITVKSEKKIDELAIELIMLMNEEFGYEFIIEDGHITKVIDENGNVLECVND